MVRTLDEEIDARADERLWPSPARAVWEPQHRQTRQNQSRTQQPPSTYDPSTATTGRNSARSRIDPLDRPPVKDHWRRPSKHPKLTDKYGTLFGNCGARRFLCDPNIRSGGSGLEIKLARSNRAARRWAAQGPPLLRAKTIEPSTSSVGCPRHGAKANCNPRRPRLWSRLPKTPRRTQNALA